QLTDTAMIINPKAKAVEPMVSHTRAWGRSARRVVFNSVSAIRSGHDRGSFKLRFLLHGSQDERAPACDFLTGGLEEIYRGRWRSLWRRSEDEQGFELPPDQTNATDKRFLAGAGELIHSGEVKLFGA